MAWTPGNTTFLVCIIAVVLLARPSHAFGAGNIGSTSAIEGQNWRHGDIEDTLLTLLMSRAAGGKKFSKLDVKRVYFGNWLRDYSQAVDVGTVKYVSAEAIRIMLWVLGFVTFGYGTGEFEVTTERLGCYQPTEHIDNPKNYADNIDARQYDRRLRGPVDEDVELAINPETGLKNYIASENLNIDTSAALVRKLFRKSIELGRQFGRNGNKKDLYEALRLLGTGCHCLEDYSAHSNYTELALIELGERDVFPHVGRSTKLRIPGARGEVYPIITGTFGGTDFLHSVMGEFSDKATQSEIQELEGTMENFQRQGEAKSVVQDLLSKIPDSLFGGKDEAGKADELQQNAQAAQMSNAKITPREPEEWANYINDVQKQIYPIIEWHDEIMKSITEAIDQIPVLPELIEQIQEQINIFVFSLLAPFVLPIIKQVKSELATGSSEIIKSSQEQQHIVFNDDDCSDPTHSMLSKDHFSNILNEPAGKVASQVLKWVVPQIIKAWDDDNVDIRRVNDRIIHGVFHHPAQREQGDDGAAEGRRLMFQTVQKWWEEQSDREKNGLRNQLSRAGVEAGRNHKEGVHDTGHGCNKPLAMNSVTGGKSGQGSSGYSAQTNQVSNMASEAVGGGALGGLVGGLVGGVGASFLGGAFGEDEKKQKKSSYGNTQSQSESGYHKSQSSNDPERHGQASYSQTQTSHGGRREEYQSTYSESTPSYGGGSGNRYEQTSYQQSTDYQQPSYDNDNKSQKYRQQKKKDSDDDDDDDDDDYKKEKKRREKEEKKRQKEQNRRRNSNDDDSDDDKKRGGYGRQEQKQEYGGGYQQREEQQSYGGGGRQEYGSGGYGGRQEESYGGGRREEYGGGPPGGFDEPRREEYGGGYGGGRREEGGFGGGRREEGGFGGGRREEGGFGGGRREEGGYGGGPPGGFGGDDAYGGGRVGPPGGFGGEEQEEGGYGGGRRQGGGGYGGRDEREEGGYGGGRGW